MNRDHDIMGGLLRTLVVVLILGALGFGITARCSAPPPCKDSIRVMSWLHYNEASCSHKQHQLSVWRVGLKVVMKCTCTATKGSP